VAAAAENRLMSPGMPTLTANQMRAQAAPLGAPLILSPRMSVPTSAASLLSGGGPPQMEHHPGLIYATPYTDYSNYAALAAGNPILTEYADHTGGLFAR
jgi:protein quaking